MKTELTAGDLAGLTTELLVVMAFDAADKKAQKENGSQAKPLVKLLTTDESVAKAAESVRTSGEFAAASCETLLLHVPEGLKAKRLLLVGVGKPVPQEIRKAAGGAIRAAKARSSRSRRSS